MSVAALILKAFSAAVSFFAALIAFLNERRHIQSGEDRAAARSLKEQISRVEKARAARRSVDPRRLPDDDPDRRD